MFTSNERNIRKQAQVDFTRSGWRQFFRLNRSLGARFLRGFVLRYELAAYVEETPCIEGEANPQQPQRSDTAPVQASDTTTDKEPQERPNNNTKEDEDGKVQ